MRTTYCPSELGPACWQDRPRCPPQTSTCGGAFLSQRVVGPREPGPVLRSVLPEGLPSDPVGGPWGAVAVLSLGVDALGQLFLGEWGALHGCQECGRGAQGIRTGS